MKRRTIFQCLVIVVVFALSIGNTALWGQSPRTAEELFERSQTFMNADTPDPDRAIADLNEVIRIDPNFENGRAYYARGSAYQFGKGEFDKAIADFTQTICLTPAAFAYWSRGNAYLAKGDYDHAIGDMAAALRIDPTDDSAKQGLVSSYYERAGSWFTQQDWNRAIADLESLLWIDPADENAKANLATTYIRRGNDYYNKKDWSNAIADYEMALRINPNISNVQQNLDYARQMRGR